MLIYDVVSYIQILKETKNGKILTILLSLVVYYVTYIWNGTQLMVIEC